MARPRPPRLTKRDREVADEYKALSRHQKKEVDDLSKFIDAHGGRLGMFRGYGMANRCTRRRPPRTARQSRPRTASRPAPRPDGAAAPTHARGVKSYAAWITSSRRTRDTPHRLAYAAAACHASRFREARLAELDQWEVDADSYRAQVVALRARWKDWEGALQGDGGKDVELSRQLIKKLLVSPVLVQPTEKGSWQWTAVASYEGPLKGFVGHRPAAQAEKPADPAHVARPPRGLYREVHGPRGGADRWRLKRSRRWW